jgi:hypothetical protein
VPEGTSRKSKKWSQGVKYWKKIFQAARGKIQTREWSG